MDEKALSRSVAIPNPLRCNIRQARRRSSSQKSSGKRDRPSEEHVVRYSFAFAIAALAAAATSAVVTILLSAYPRPQRFRNGCREKQMNASSCSVLEVNSRGHVVSAVASAVVASAPAPLSDALVATVGSYRKKLRTYTPGSPFVYAMFGATTQMQGYELDEQVKE
ncbi:hypothetical protein EDB92DRAFT_1820573 [Lactarius akahatsu]|uniref:Uncharacterized protein n=1 Tax=Lactarius akahatsu TaxID=416441 RepID=A0AAD4L6N9_9AGAM|nr:hypothetical protein EDB92DRAFT_1820573 [Lactarius akahatsu]